MKSKPWLALGGTLILFSTFEIVSKTISQTVPSLQINFWRFLIGGAALLPFALIINAHEHRRLTRADYLRLARLGIVMVGISLPLLQQGIVYIPASVAAVLFCTNPLFAFIFSAWLEKEKMEKRTWAGLLISLLGTFIIIWGEVIALHFNWQTMLGIGLTLASALFFGLYIVLAKGEAEKVGSVTANSLTFISGAVVTIPLLLWFKVPLFTFDIAALPQMLYLALGITCGAYLLFLYALRYLSAGTGSLIFFIKPLLASLLAVLWLGEDLTVSFVAGTLVVVGGLFVTHKKKTSPPD